MILTNKKSEAKASLGTYRFITLFLCALFLLASPKDKLERSDLIERSEHRWRQWCQRKKLNKISAKEEHKKRRYKKRLAERQNSRDDTATRKWCRFFVRRLLGVRTHATLSFTTVFLFVLWFSRELEKSVHKCYGILSHFVASSQTEKSQNHPRAQFSFLQLGSVFFLSLFYFFVRLTDGKRSRGKWWTSRQLWDTIHWFDVIERKRKKAPENRRSEKMKWSRFWRQCVDFRVEKVHRIHIRF